MPVVRTDGLSVYGHVITRFSRMDRLLHFLTHGALLARFVRESSAISETITRYASLPLLQDSDVKHSDATLFGGRRFILSSSKLECAR